MLLQQVAKLQLKRGHQPSAICTARLPCSSVAALHSLPGPTAVEKEFLLVATYTDSDLAEGGSGQVRQAGQQGFLSVFEVCLAQQGKHASSRYDISWLSRNNALRNVLTTSHGVSCNSSPMYELAATMQGVNFTAMRFANLLT